MKYVLKEDKLAIRFGGMGSGGGGVDRGKLEKVGTYQEENEFGPKTSSEELVSLSARPHLDTQERGRIILSTFNYYSIGLDGIDQ